MAIIKFSGTPIEKLIETVSQGIGVLYEPRRIKKKADAEAYRLEKLEEAKAKGLILKSDAEFEIIDRARERFAHKEINRQINLESIVEKSSKHLSESVSEEPVDDDWRTRFFNKAQDVSNEEMQEIWGKILAEEVTQPGRISFRTLEVISNLSKKEAEIFERSCKLAVNGGMILKADDNNAFDDYGINYSDLLVLRSAGLIYDSDNLIVKFKTNKLVNGVLLNYGKTIFIASKGSDTEITFNQVKFTPAGNELMQIISAEKNLDYLYYFKKKKEEQGFTINIPVQKNAQ
ncbi:DUF2806 domain-containing protein [Pontixanthobacter gangjinensis]|uniref:DUF2806 domain-containing protein n=1 Tax=Christiangramia aestuarii TaxID=1028746 RepID=A0A7K1LT01_9FLAO|nr:DUF2806 domain-containing protein [Christiangramia aestuarii]MUP43907.1 DUF2806 domain-containing protein [Christiangramia aestuarii]